MVTVEQLHKHEADGREWAEALRTSEREARQLRVALAEALSSGTDLPNTMQELTLLKQSTVAATNRVQSLEDVNKQIHLRIVEINEQNRKLRKNQFDVQNESDLMREVIVEQNETLLRKVDDLTEE